MAPLLSEQLYPQLQPASQLNEGHKNVASSLSIPAEWRRVPKKRSLADEGDFSKVSHSMEAVRKRNRIAPLSTGETILPTASPVEQNSVESLVESVRTKYKLLQQLKKHHQWGQSPPWDQALHSEIEFIYSNPDAEAKRQGLARVYETIRGMADLAEARINIAHRLLNSPPLAAKSPAWLDGHCNDVETMSGRKESSFRCLEKLLRVTAVHIDIPEPSLFEEHLDGLLVLRWDFNNVIIQWDIEPPRLKWPGVSARVLVIDKDKDPKITARTFVSAVDVAAHFKDVVENGSGR